MLLRQSPSGAINSLPSFASSLGNVNVGAVASIDWQQGPAQELTLSQSCSVSSLNLPAGQPTWMQIECIQGSGGSFVPTFIGAKTPGGAALVLSTAPGSRDLISLYWSGSVLYAAVSGLAFS